jgi:predicted nucleotidyltransferase component of viral defense system
MKSLNIIKHKTVMTNILLDIYKNSDLASVLGFKGGTAAMLFYGLPRFSVDLDFDLIKKYAKDSKEFKNIFEKITKLLSSKYKIVDQCLKYNTLFWAVSYGNGLAHIKVEISTRDNSYNQYDLISFYGVQIKVMRVEYMIAHKLLAVMERKSLANRDLFDVHYFLSSVYAGEINYEVIKHRIGKKPREFYLQLLKYVSSIKLKSVLSGLGEVLTESQKDWAKVKLVVELKGLIQRQIDLL